ncbi:E3 ubiquitin-protein ligase TRIM62-like isoform X1 [Protopterus annectens]|uniref:E3 ubiquitin-protein ligase TRIM62-like isoform X1 n=1 Tax=Protopterus annectens TaxID=7888 RepID=UPI001CFA88A8|nr:E3 ubiquitin-protein ligase TRIM62-like isoform X1 [Protopterus annectens]
MKEESSAYTNRPEQSYDYMPVSCTDHCIRNQSAVHRSEKYRILVPTRMSGTTDTTKEGQALSLTTPKNLLDELSDCKAKTEAYIQTLKKRSQVITNRTDELKQQVSEQYNAMRELIDKDEQAALELIEEDKRRTLGNLTKVMKEQSQELDHIVKSIKNAQKGMEQLKSGNKQQDIKINELNKMELSERNFRINEPKFQKLLRILANLTKDLQAKLQRKMFLLDNCLITFDKKTLHKNLLLSNEHTSLSSTSDAQTVTESPLQFDKVCSALASNSLNKGRYYWEVNVHSCSEWSIGIAYGAIERKGNQKSAKLGRNRLSWCIEMRNNRLLAWHNDKSISCGTKPLKIQQVGVLVNCERSTIAFYNVENMKLLHEFSSATATLFNRMHHHFTDPVFPAFRLFPSISGAIKSEKLDICTPTF